MARLHLAALLFAAALVVTSGTRLPLQAAAPAPAPGAAQNGADVLFTMEADQGTFTDAQTLTLSGLTSSAQSFAVGGKTAVYPIAAFVGNQFVDTAGAWLGNPQAVFYGVNAQGNVTSAVLALSSPKINTPAPGTTNNNNNNNNNNNGGTITNNNNNNGQTLSFTVAAVPADAAKVKMPGGAVSQKVTESASGADNGFVTSITPGAQFSSIVLFIDTNQQSVSKVAATKWGWGGYYQPSYYNQGYNYGWGSSNNNNNNNNNGGWGAVNNNNNNNNNGGWGANNNNNNNNNNGGYGAVNNNNNNNNNGFGGANNNNNNNNNGRH